MLRVKRWIQPELDRAVALLRKANAQLERTLEENTQLKNRNEQLHVQVNRLMADTKELHHQLEMLRQANTMQGETIAKMEKYQKELMDKYEHMLTRVIMLEARKDKA